MDYIKFDTNIPVEMAFTHAEGVLKDGQWGDYFFRTTTDGRGVSLKREVESKILDLEIQPGEMISICKREQKQGNRRNIIWEVKRVDPPGAPATQPPAASRTASGVSPAKERTPQAVPSAQCLAKPNGTATENHTAPATPERAERPILHTQMSLALSSCVLAAIDAARRANEYSATVGLPLRFAEDHIQAWASTLYIQVSKQSNIDQMNRRHITYDEACHDTEGQPLAPQASGTRPDARTVNGGTAPWPQ